MKQEKIFGYEVKCSEELARKLGAKFKAGGGRDVLFWSDGYLWWVTAVNLEKAKG